MPSIAFRVLVSCIAALACWAWPSVSPGQTINRCAGRDGTLVFTDRRCEDVDATERLPRNAAQAPHSSGYRSGCARNLPDLIGRLTASIDARDVNALAASYHWVGISGSGSAGVLARLGAIAQRPLVDIVALQPARRVVVDAVDMPVDGSAVDYVAPPTSRVPTALRLEQNSANGTTPMRTVLGLRRYLDCWWVTL